MSEIKRVWSDKKTTWNNKEQVWLKDWELKKYDGEWKDVEWNIDVYEGSAFETLPWSAELDTYDSNTPEFIWTVEDWIEAAYVFKDWDGTVLKSGKVKDWETPVAPTDPTREATVQYTYTFAWWNPTVWPITKSTEYVATYTATVNNYTVTIAVNDNTMWSVDVNSVTVPYWTEATADGNELTIGETTITATAESWYEFVEWTNVWIITNDSTITANFQAVVPPTPTGQFSNAAMYWDEQGEWDATSWTVLFADNREDADRVEIEFSYDDEQNQWNGSVRWYWVYDPDGWEAQPSTTSLITMLEWISWEVLAAAFYNWASYPNCEGEIDSTLISALDTAWESNESSDWNAAANIIADAETQWTPLIEDTTIWVDTISAPVPSSVTLEEWANTTVRINYTPTNATPTAILDGAGITVESDDENVAYWYIDWVSWDWECTIYVEWYTVGTATLTIQTWDGSQTQTLSVEVTSAQV